VSYRVFARKYRPQTFEEVVGQDHITRTLRNAIATQRVAQAYLFVGPRGTGKTSTARILAKSLNCENGPTATPCGVCDACVEIADGRSLDVLEIDGASNNGVENIRELRENAAYAPAKGPCKIYLIDEVHMLSPGAFNALLKTLEEPPPHVKFIFATTEAQKVPATITSRCQRFDLRRIPADEIASHLLDIAGKEKITLDADAAAALARGAEGGLRDAESMLDQAVAFCGETISGGDVMTVFGFTAREVVESFVGRLLARDATGALGIIAQQSEAGRDLSRLLSDVIGRVRDLLVEGVVGSSEIPRDKLLLLLDHFAETEARMRWATDRKLQLDVAAIKAVHLLDQTSLDEVLATLTALRSGEAPPPRQSAAPPPKPVAIRVDSPEPPVPPKAAAKSAAPVEGEALPQSAWPEIAAAFGSTLKYGWIARGVFWETRTDGTVVVYFPPSATELDTFVGEAGRKEAETRLSQALRRKVKVEFAIDGAMSEPVATESDPEIAEPEPPPVALAPPAKAADPMSEFKNDPFIQQALAIFKAELQTP